MGKLSWLFALRMSTVHVRLSIKSVRVLKVNTFEDFAVHNTATVNIATVLDLRMNPFTCISSLLYLKSQYR